MKVSEHINMLENMLEGKNYDVSWRDRYWRRTAILAYWNSQGFITNYEHLNRIMVERDKEYQRYLQANLSLAIRRSEDEMNNDDDMSEKTELTDEFFRKYAEMSSKIKREEWATWTVSDFAINEWIKIINAHWYTRLWWRVCDWWSSIRTACQFFVVWWQG